MRGQGQPPLADVLNIMTPPIQWTKGLVLEVLSMEKEVRSFKLTISHESPRVVMLCYIPHPLNRTLQLYSGCASI